MTQNVVYECCGCSEHSENRYPVLEFQDITGILFRIFVCPDCQESLIEMEKKEPAGKFVSFLQEMANRARQRHQGL